MSPVSVITEEPLFDLAAFVAAANRMKRDIPALTM
jgi:hypothetical protein